VGQASDEGNPSVTQFPDSVQAKAFMSIAKLLAAQASVLAMSRRDLNRMGGEKRPEFKPVS